MYLTIIFQLAIIGLVVAWYNSKVAATSRERPIRIFGGIVTVNIFPDTQSLQTSDEKQLSETSIPDEQFPKPKSPAIPLDELKAISGWLVVELLRLDIFNESKYGEFSQAPFVVDAEFIVDEACKALYEVEPDPERLVDAVLSDQITNGIISQGTLGDIKKARTFFLQTLGPIWPKQFVYGNGGVVYPKRQKEL